MVKNPKEEISGVTPMVGLKAIGLAAAFGGDVEMTAAVGLLAAGVGKKIFRGLFKKKNQTQEDEETDNDSPNNGSPEKKESKNKNYTDNEVIISILNKILGSFENDNERMRKSIRDAEEEKLESDPTSDTPGGPVKEGDNKKSGMNKLLMFGAIAGLLGLAYTFKDEIAKVLEPITNMLGITNPLKESDKEDYEFDIMDALGVTALLGMLGIAGDGGKSGTKPGVPGVPEVPGVKGAPEKPNAKSNVRERHPAGAKNAAGKSIGGRYKVPLPKEGITGIIVKHVGKVAGRILPGVGLGLGLWDAFDRASKGDLTGSAIALGGGVAGLFPGVGTGVAIAAAATNIARDVYNEAYGVFPENDESGEKAKRAKDILDEIVQTMIGHKYTPMTAQQKELVHKELGDYAAVVENPSPMIRQRARMKLNKAAAAAGISKDAVETEITLIKDEASDKITGVPSKNAQDLLDLKESSAAASAASAVATAPSANAGVSVGAPSAAVGAAVGAPSAAAGAPAGTGTAKGDMPVGSPAVSSPPPASGTSGSTVTAATMDASKAKNSVTVLPPIINNQTNTMKSGNENASKAQNMTMQVRLNDDVFRKAIDATAAVLKAA